MMAGIGDCPDTACDVFMWFGGVLELTGPYVAAAVAFAIVMYVFGDRR